MTPIAKNIIDDAITAMGIKDFGKATIREIVAIAQTAEKASGQEFVKMESIAGRHCTSLSQHQRTP